MEQNKMERVLSAGLSAGADFSEIFIEETRSATVALRDGKVETAVSGIDYGIGIRLIRDGEVFYAYTSEDAEEILLSMIQDLSLAIASSKGLREAKPLAYGPPGLQHTILIQPVDRGQKAKPEYLRRADKAAREVSPLIQQVSAGMSDETSHILIANSEGLIAEDKRVRSRLSLNVTASENGEIFSAHEAPGAMAGFEFFDTLNYEELAAKAAERALTMLKADYAEGRKMPVILGNGFGGVIFHEACGHPLETEAVRLGASPFAGKIGQQIAHSAVSAVDDGTILNSWGSISIDDEGMPTEKTQLIKDGILQTFLSDRVGAEAVGVPRSGSARRESYRYAPVSRMRNTYIEAGSSTPAQLIQSVEDGIYAVKMGGGSVNPSTGEFNFAVEEGYKIEHGKITKPLRGATLIGLGQEILMQISGVANDFEIAAGMCGASSGSVPVTVGQPTIKVDEILVGGR